MDIKDRIHIRKLILEFVDIFSDKEYQEHAWVHGKGPDYDEAIMVFSEIYEPIIPNYHDFFFSDKQQILLHELYKRIEDYDDCPAEDAQDIINDPHWIEIRKFAKSIYPELIKEYRPNID